jgi:hypothetical protein
MAVSLQVNEMTALDASSVAGLLREFGQRSALSPAVTNFRP